MGFFEWFKKERTSNNSSELDMTRELEIFLKDQIDRLSIQGIPVFFNEITAAYIISLLSVSRKSFVKSRDAQSAANNLFAGNKSKIILINNAFQILNNDVEAKIKLAALFKVAEIEISTQKYDFLVRHSKKGQKEIDAMFEPNPDWDPRNEPSWSPKDLA